MPKDPETPVITPGADQTFDAPMGKAAPLTKPLPDPSSTHVGKASWYGPGFNGKQTAMGTKFNQNDVTIAHRTLPLGSYAKVTDTDTGKSIRAKVTDRGPYVGDRVADLSKGAAAKLGTLKKGVANVGIEPERFVKRGRR